MEDGKKRYQVNNVLSNSETKFVSSDDSVDSDTLPAKKAVGLQRTVTLLGGVALIAGTMIGSGIFVSPKGVLEDTGSVGLSLVVWTACGILSMLGALAYAELGAMITKSGGEWVYINTAFGPLNRYIGELPAFLFSWMSVVVLKPSSVAIISLTFSEYIMTPFFDSCGPPTMVIKLLTAVSIIFMAAVNVYSPKAGNKIQVLFFIVKLLALIGIIIGGFYQMTVEIPKHIKSGFNDSVFSAAAIARAFYKGLWAYDGWNNLNYVTEEIINPTRNVPLAICISIPLVTGVYILANIAYFTVLTPQALLESDAVAVDWALILLPSVAVVITICVSFSTLGAANGTLISGSRLVYAAARGGHLMSILAMIDVRYHSPSPSIIFTSIIAILMVIPADIFTLIDFFSFSAWIFYGFTMAAVIILRWKRPELERPFKCPIIIPVLVLLASVYLVFAPIIDKPDILYLYASIFMFGGCFLYVPFVVFKKHPKGLEYFTAFMQKMMLIAPSDHEPDE